MPKPIALTQGKFAIVDDEDYDAVSKFKWRYWSNKCTQTGYAVRTANRKNLSLQNFILEHPSGMCVDHINGNGLDCRRENLRICTYRENLKNKKRNRDSHSPYKGVRQECQKWSASIMSDGKIYRLGLFDTPEDAARAYNEAAKQYHGEFARLNEIPGDQPIKTISDCILVPDASIWDDRNGANPGDITIKEAANLLQIDESQVRRYCQSGKLKCTKIGWQWLLHRCDVEKFTPAPVGRPRKER